MAAVTAKVQIFPSKEEKELLLATSRQYEEACNFVSAYVMKTHDLSQVSLNRQLYTSLRSEYLLKAQMAQSAIKSVIAAYKTILTNQKEWIQPSFSSPFLDLVWNRDYSLRPGSFSVNTLSGRLKLSYAKKGMEKYFDGTWKFGTAKLLEKHGKWFLHIPVSKDLPELENFQVKNVVGVDLGINFMAATYDSADKSFERNYRNGKQLLPDTG